MIVACVLFLLEGPVGTPSPTPVPPGSVGRSTPVPAGGSLQDLAKRRRGIAPGDAMKGSFSVSTEGTSGPLRHEDLKGRIVEGGLLIEGKARDEHVQLGPHTAFFSVLEVFARRRDGRLVRAIAPLAWKETSDIFGTEIKRGSIDSPLGRVSTATFSCLFASPTSATEPAFLLPETAGGRFHEYPHPWTGSPEGRDYLRRISCLSYWVKPVRGPNAKENDRVEVHVLNACAWSVRQRDTWFVVREQTSFFSAVEEKIWGVFGEDVPANGELQTEVFVPVPKDSRVRVIPWRLEITTND